MKVRTGKAAAFFRFGRSLAVYLVGLVILALAPLWTYLDGTFVTGVMRAGHETTLDSRISVVDLNVDETHILKGVVSFLDTLHGAIQKRHVVPPTALVLDIIFTNAHHEDGITPQGVADAIRRVRNDGTAVYVAVDPYKPGSIEYRPRFMDTLVPQIYNDAATGVGHTEMRVAAGSGQNALLWYRAAVPERPGNEVMALPLVATGAVGEPPGRHVIFSMGKTANFSPAVKTVQTVRANPATLSSGFAVVGSTGGADSAYGMNGLEGLTWALNDRLTAGSAGHVNFFGDRMTVIGFTLVLTLLAVGTFALVFRLLQPRRITLPVAAAAAAVVPIGTLLAAVAILASRDVIYLQPSFEIAATFLASIVCWGAGREQLRSNLLRTAYEQGKKAVSRHYDVFVSYSRDEENERWVEENVVRPLRSAKRDDGKPFEVFFDREKIGSGMAWYEEIVEALWGSRFIVPIYTPRFFERPMCTEELVTAMRRRIDDPSFAILPISRMGGDVPPRFAGIQYQDAATNPHFIGDVIDAIRRLDTAAAAVSAATATILDSDDRNDPKEVHV